MTQTQFWRSASNRGLLGGGALFLVNIIGWWLKLETGSQWLYELLMFAVIFALIFYTGRENARTAGAAGYSYGRAVGFVFAMMLFVGIVYGVGKFLMINFIARDYYDALNAANIDKALAVYRGTPMYDQALTMRSTMVRWMSNPFYLIFVNIFDLVIKGGVLGLVLCAFIYKKPNIFAGDNAEKLLGPDDNE